jgi:hypothetical protein
MQYNNIEIPATIISNMVACEEAARNAYRAETSADEKYWDVKCGEHYNLAVQQLADIGITDTYVDILDACHASFIS